MLLPAFHTWRSCLSSQRWTACLGCPCSCVDLNLALSDCETRLFTKAPAAPRSHREPLLVRGRKPPGSTQNTSCSRGCIPGAEAPGLSLEEVTGRRDLA